MAAWVSKGQCCSILCGRLVALQELDLGFGGSGKERAEQAGGARPLLVSFCCVDCSTEIPA